MLMVVIGSCGDKLASSLIRWSAFMVPLIAFPSRAIRRMPAVVGTFDACFGPCAMVTVPSIALETRGVAAGAYDASPLLPATTPPRLVGGAALAMMDRAFPAVHPRARGGDRARTGWPRRGWAWSCPPGGGRTCRTGPARRR